MLRTRIAAAVFLCAPLMLAQNYKVTAHWKVGGQGGWDYMLSDDAAHRLYIAHNTRVEVVDTASGKLVGAVTGLKGTHGIALNPDGRTGYISDGAGNAIVVFNRTDLSKIATVPVGTNPDGITYEPTTRTIWAFNGRSHDASVLDTASNQVIATVSLPGKPEFPQPDGMGNVYVNIEDKNSIVKIAAKAHQVTGTWALEGCESPSGMAIDQEKHRLFSVCDGGKMAIVSYDTGKVLGLGAIGDSPDAAAYDSKSGLAFSSNGGDGTLTVIAANKPGFPVAQTLKTAKRAKTMALNRLTGAVYLASAEFAPAQGNARPTAVADTFEVLVVSR